MKTLPEILVDGKGVDENKLRPRLMKGGVYGYEISTNGLKALEQAIAKELMGCLPEYRDNTDSPIPLPQYDDLISVEVNKTIDEVRARLTAFIGKEK